MNGITVKGSSVDEKLLHAVSKRNVKKVEDLLVNNNVKLSPNYYDYALSLACSFGCFKLVKLLVEHNAGNGETLPNGVSYILALCRSKSKKEDELLRCLDLLLSRGADKDYCDSNGTCIMSHAVKYDHEKIILKLINNRADVNKSDVDGWSPIFYAVGCNNIYLVSLLKDYGANIYMLDHQGRSLIDVSLEIGNNNIVLLLNGSLDLTKWYKHLPSIVENKNYYSIHETISSKLPNEDDRLSGFNEEVLNILKSINLCHLIKKLHEHNVGLGHLLTSNDDKLKEVGINFMFDRKKLLNAIQHFHEHPWNTSSLETSTKYQELSFKITQLMTTIGRQMYLISISSYWWAKNGGIDNQQPKLPHTLKNSLRTIKTLRKTVIDLNMLFVKIGEKHNYMPSDLITPKTKKFNIASILVPCLCGLLIYRTNLHNKIYNIFLNSFHNNFI